MEQYIPKSALVAEINKLKGKVFDGSSYCNGWQHALRMLELPLDTLEVKEVNVDFEQELYKAFGQIKDFTLGIAIAKRFYDIGRKHNEPVSEDLEEAAIRAAMLTHDIPKEHLHEYLYNDYGMMKFVEGAKWQEEKDNEEKVLIYKHGFEDCKEQLMKDATEVTVHIDAGGYPYIPQMELYDYDKDVPLAKEWDRYKVILIKEE